MGKVIDLGLNRTLAERDTVHISRDALAESAWDLYGWKLAPFREMPDFTNENMQKLAVILREEHHYNKVVDLMIDALETTELR